MDTSIAIQVLPSVLEDDEICRIVDEVIAEMLINGTYTVDEAIEEILFQADML